MHHNKAGQSSQVRPGWSTPGPAAWAAIPGRGLAPVRSGHYTPRCNHMDFTRYAAAGAPAPPADPVTRPTRDLDGRLVNCTGASGPGMPAPPVLELGAHCTRDFGCCIISGSLFPLRWS